MVENNKSLKIIIGILIVIVVGLLGYIIGSKMLENSNNNDVNNNENVNNNNNNQNNNGTNVNNSQNDNINNEQIKSKFIKTDECKNYETTFNGITIKISNKKEDAMCLLNNISINGKNVTDENSLWISSYEIYDKSVLIKSGGTGDNLLNIYNGSELKYSFKPENSENFWANEYKIQNGKLIINGRNCGQQCSNDEIYTMSCEELKNKGLNRYKEATFESEYINGSFTKPVMVSKVSDCE